MARVSKFTDEQKMEIALELLSGKVSHAEVCRKWDISRQGNLEVSEKVRRCGTILSVLFVGNSGRQICRGIFLPPGRTPLRRRAHLEMSRGRLDCHLL
jgi:hypothetical protein